VKRPKIAEFEHVSKAYAPTIPGRRRVRALKDVSFSVLEGEVFGLLGPNRAGKSTLVKALLTICRPSSGKIARFGHPWNDRRTLARVGYIHESQSLPGYLTAQGLLEYYGGLSGMSRGLVKARTAELLEQVNLSDRNHEPISRFSKGMVQRLALAQALMNEPELLVLDEPTEGMDLLARRMVYEAIDHQRRIGLTAIIVSHALGDVERWCDRVAVLREGELVFLGPMTELTWDAAQSKNRTLEKALEPLYEVAGS
jgi:ABC-2 type transport system ATP-binding protein